MKSRSGSRPPGRVGRRVGLLDLDGVLEPHRRWEVAVALGALLGHGPSVRRGPHRVPRVRRSPTVRPRTGPPPAGRPAPGTASRTRSPARPRGRSGPTRGRRRARRRRRACRSGRAARPSSTAMPDQRARRRRGRGSRTARPEDALAPGSAEKNARLDVVAGEAPGHLGQVVGAEGEELGGLGDLAGGQRGPRQLDHRADRDVEARRRSRSATSAATCSTSSRTSSSSCTRADQRDHDLRPRVAAGLDAARRRPRRSPGPASRTGRGSTRPSRTPRRPSIGFCSCSRCTASSSLRVARLSCVARVVLGQRPP